MACPLCGEVCFCTPRATPIAVGSLRRPRFLPETEDVLEAGGSAILIDREATDSSEQQFMASLEKSHPPISRSRFVLDDDDKEQPADLLEKADLANAEGDLLGLALTSEETLSNLKANSVIPQAAPGVSAPEVTDSPTDHASALVAPDKALALGPLTPEADPFWKDELAARLNQYRARRKPRPPKYPSLRLKFDPGDKRPDPEVRPAPSRDIPATRESVAFVADESASVMAKAESAPPEISANSEILADTARIIEFPRSYYFPALPPPAAGNELAEPVLDRPRIVEVPDMEMPEPALGGIILEPEEPEPERRPGFEIPLQTASKRRRLMASGCDGAIVLGACILFGCIVFKIAGGIPPIATLGTLGCVLTVLFWSAYQYLLLTYAGTTPGLRISHLRLSQFDGSPVSRRLRRWRVIASLLSGLSLGLGYAWCFLDEDALCWHDRITHTYLKPLK